MSRALCVAVLCGLGAPAAATPDSDPTAGRAVFTGATMPDATSIDLNPAALGLGTIDFFYLAGTAVLDRFAIDRRNLDINTGATSAGPSVRDYQLGPGFNAALVLHVIKDRAALALELHSAPPDVFPGGQSALKYQTLGGDQRTIAGTFGGSVKITNTVIFGLSIAYQATYLSLKYARDTALANGTGPNGINSNCGGAPCGVGNPLATETYDVDVHTSLASASDSVVANVGFVVGLWKDAWIAASYHTPPGLAIENELTGSMDIVRAPRDGGGTLNGGAVVYISEPASADAEFRSRLAQQLDLHIGFRWQDLSRLSAYDVRGYGSTFAANGIPEWTERPRGFHDPFSLWAGVEQVDLGERLRFGARLGVETSAVHNDQTSPMTIAPLSFTADVGVQLRATPSMIVQLTYGLQYFPTVNVTTSDYDPRDQINCINSGYNYSTPACSAVRYGYSIDSADGSYSRIEQAARLSLRREF